MWFILGAIGWIIFAFWPAYVARKKGYSFILFFILSIFFFFIALIIAYLLTDKTKTTLDIKDDRIAEAALNKEEKEELARRKNQ
jgi:phosphotransferase system  glucose/maltose/N-acetylglucosamine-specific IIC component